MRSRVDESLVSLRYPNGQVHQLTLTTAMRLKPGDEFDLYGHHWKAVELTTVPRGAREWQRMLCVLADEDGHA